MIKKDKKLERGQPPRREFPNWPKTPRLDLERVIWDWEYRESTRPIWSRAS